jgi:hypothetical protein
MRRCLLNTPFCSGNRVQWYSHPVQGFPEILHEYSLDNKTCFGKDNLDYSVKTDCRKDGGGISFPAVAGIG